MFVNSEIKIFSFFQKVEREVKRATKKLLSPPLSTSFLNPEKISGFRKKS
jgi:hypothetical protein